MLGEVVSGPTRRVWKPFKRPSERADIKLMAEFASGEELGWRRGHWRLCAWGRRRRAAAATSSTRKPLRPPATQRLPSPIPAPACWARPTEPARAQEFQKFYHLNLYMKFRFQC
ncbi:hypothetical protein EVAR_93000_1 [Eumeta japonica]|uniref:Uncharacterized protein n=1 Tax=Eumeta variegata TaxID=151549 RepID=A0A4C1TAJ1_EUMVA|nr:hypothetical protein EVAR_93000_1 [Eumeta japonica]